MSESYVLFDVDCHQKGFDHQTFGICMIDRL